MAVVAGVPFSLLPSRGKRRPFNLMWLLISLVLFVVAFALTAADVWWSFWLTLAGMVSSLALLAVLLLATLEEDKTRAAARAKKPVR